MEDMIKEAFRAVEGINEAKKVYKEFARKLHPDVGGTDEDFKLLNKIYNDYIENGLRIKEDAEFDLELEKIISQILHFENIVIEVIGSWIWISGDTRAIKETLKEIGFKWANKKKMWYYGEMKGRNPKQKDINDIKAKYGSKVVNSKTRDKITA